MDHLEEDEDGASVHDGKRSDVWKHTVAASGGEGERR